MFAGPATLKLAGVSVNVQVTVHSRRAPAPNGDTVASWDGYFVGAPEDIARLADAKQPRLATLRTADDSETVTVLITHIIGDHGEFEGIGAPPSHMRR